MMAVRICGGLAMGFGCVVKVLTLGMAGLLFAGGATISMPAMAASKVAETAAKAGQAHLVWVDTDIGDDIDDAFALGLVLKSPEFKVLGISAAFGNTELRARLVDRFLTAAGRTEIPVFAGVHTETDNVMTQAAYAKRSPERKHADGVTGLLAAIRAHPGQVTLIALGPLFNVGAAIDRDPGTFGKLKRVVMMGGSIHGGYFNGKTGAMDQAEPEWNIQQAPKDAGKLFAAGVPIFMMPLDSTQVHLGAEERERVFREGDPVTDQLTLLYHEWGMPTPTLYDPVAVAYALNPEICPMEPMRIEVDAAGMTKPVEGQPNAQVCLKSDEKGFLKLLVGSLTGSEK
jgi:purine nucleosidase